MIANSTARPPKQILGDLNSCFGQSEEGDSGYPYRSPIQKHASRFTSGKNNWTPTKSDFSRRDYSSCFGGSSYQTEMAITAILRFTGLPVR